MSERGAAHVEIGTENAKKHPEAVYLDLTSQLCNYKTWETTYVMQVLLAIVTSAF